MPELGILSIRICTFFLSVELDMGLFHVICVYGTRCDCDDEGILGEMAAAWVGFMGLCNLTDHGGGSF